MAKKKALGRGLSELFNDDFIIDELDKVHELDLDLIKPNPNQPRKIFDQSGLQELASSIKHYGIIQPIVVKKSDDLYFIIAGERRFRAAKIANMKTIPSIIKDVDDTRLAELALIENIQREDLNPIEEAMGYETMIKLYDKSQEEISNIVNKSRTYVTNILRLLKLSEYVRQCVVDKKISQGHARAMISLDEDLQKHICDRIISRSLSVREVERIVKAYNEDEDVTVKKVLVKDDFIIDLENRLTEKFSAKINIVDKNNKGKIEIPYGDVNEFNRILELLGEKSEI